MSIRPRVDLAAKLKRAGVRACRVCGCTENDPCLDEMGTPCGWAPKAFHGDEPLCDFCAAFASTAIVAVAERGVSMAELVRRIRRELEYRESAAIGMAKAKRAGMAD